MRKVGRIFLNILLPDDEDYLFYVAFAVHVVVFDGLFADVVGGIYYKCIDGPGGGDTVLEGI